MEIKRLRMIIIVIAVIICAGLTVYLYTNERRVVLNLISIMSSSKPAIDRLYGPPMYRPPMRDDGGFSKKYYGVDYKRPCDFSITLDNRDRILDVGISQEWLFKHGYRFNNWKRWIYKFGFVDMPTPNEESTLAIRWNDWNGYEINISRDAYAMADENQEIKISCRRTTAPHSGHH